MKVALRFLAPISMLLAAAVPAHAAATLSEDEAIQKAVRYLMNTPYGETFVAIRSHIKQIQLITKGTSDCGPVTTPLWTFQIEKPYKGRLYLDAVTGEEQCSSLPFLR